MTQTQTAIRSKPGYDAVGLHLGFRPDLQGLRAVAVSAVFVFHLWPHNLSGGFVGVDVFFVISGFLMTAVLLREPPTSLRAFGHFWARRVRRLLPAGLLVIVATMAATRVIAPPLFWEDTAKEAFASAGYFQNWLLASSSIDYLAQDDSSSPFTHYWSLSIEEQFYILWPFVFAGIFWIVARALRSQERPRLAPAVFLGAVCTIVAASVVFSYVYTRSSPSPAYFNLLTRIWELGLGGVVAVLPMAWADAIPRRVRSVLSWIGLAAIAWSAWAYSADTEFPGVTAAVPVIATAVIILCRAESRRSAAAFLNLRPVQYLGDISYSLYLWHWPMIVLLPHVSGALGNLDHLAIIVAAIVAAGLTKRYVEDPFRRYHHTANTYRYGALAMMFVLAISAVWVYSNAARVAEDRADSAMRQLELARDQMANLDGQAPWDPSNPADDSSDDGQVSETQEPAPGASCYGADAMAAGQEVCPIDTTALPLISAEAAKDDKPAAYADGCWAWEPFDEKPVCNYGSGSVRVALTGNSHAGHWLPALQAYADAHDWTIDTYLASVCAPSNTVQKFDAQNKTTGCTDYSQWVLDETISGGYDLVITSNRLSAIASDAETPADSYDAYYAGFGSYLDRWVTAGIPVVVIKDVPFPGATTGNVPECLASHSNDWGPCNGTRESWKWYYPFYDAALDTPGVTAISMDEYFCSQMVCPAVIGGVPVYFDGSHLTQTYSSSLAPYLGSKLAEAGF